MAFRDDFGDPVAANQFGQHIGIAEDKLAEMERIPSYIDGLKRGDGLTQEVMDIWAVRWGEGWQVVWEQLKEARAIVAKRGRDVSAFDEARAAAGDIYINVASGKATRIGNEVHVQWRNNSTQPARDAIEALRKAMPEVVVQQAPVNVDLAPSSSKLFEIGVALGVMGFAAYILYRIFIG